MSIGKRKPKKAPVPIEEAKELLKPKIPKRKRRTGQSKEGLRQRDEAVKRAHSFLWAPLKKGSIFSQEHQQLREMDRMMATYADLLSSYHGKRLMNWQKRLERNSTKGCMMRAAIQRETIGCSFEDYMQAQFYFFNLWYSRAPTYAECASKWAVKRVRDYQQLQKKDQAGGTVISPETIGENALESQPLAYESKEDYDLKILEGMIERWGSEEMVWNICGDPADESIFLNAFKKTRSSWCEMFNS